MLSGTTGTDFLHTRGLRDFGPCFSGVLAGQRSAFELTRNTFNDDEWTLLRIYKETLRPGLNVLKDEENRMTKWVNSIQEDASHYSSAYVPYTFGAGASAPACCGRIFIWNKILNMSRPTPTPNRD